LRVNGPWAAGPVVGSAELIDDELRRGLRAAGGQRRDCRLGQFRSVIDDPDTSLLTEVTSQRVQRNALTSV
jgi:hypothetical protein